MSPAKQLRISRKEPTTFTSVALAPLIDFLDVREMTAFVCSHKLIGREKCAAIWSWLVSRTHALLFDVKLSTPSHSDKLQLTVVMPLLQKLLAVASFDFDLQFDATNHGSDVYLAENGKRYVSHWGPNGGSMFGDRVCVAGAVSYWECVGLNEGSYIGIAEVVMQQQDKFWCSGLDAHQLKQTLSLPTPACDHMPAVMYCEGGFVTTGSFCGPKPRLPAQVNFLSASPYKENDRVGVVVDLLAGFLLFLWNGVPQGIRIPIDRSRTYLPVFSACACFNMQIIPDVRPPWQRIYCFDQDHDTTYLPPST